MCKFIWFSHSSHWCISIKPISQLFRHTSTHWRLKDTRCNRCDSDVKPSKISCHRQTQPIQCSLTCTVCNLSSLSFFCSNTGNKENDSFFSSVIKWFILSHVDRTVFSNVDATVYIDCHKLFEFGGVESCFRCEGEHWPGDTGAG